MMYIGESLMVRWKYCPFVDGKEHRVASFEGVLGLYDGDWSGRI